MTGQSQAGRTWSACGPFWPSTTTKLTSWPSARVRKPVPSMERKCTNRSGPLDWVMKPKPLASLNHLTVPVWRSDISEVLKTKKKYHDTEHLHRDWDCKEQAGG